MQTTIPTYQTEVVAFLRELAMAIENSDVNLVGFRAEQYLEIADSPIVPNRRREANKNFCDLKISFEKSKITDLIKSVS
jgi:hypothetical protein